MIPEVRMGYSVGQVARLSGVTVRTLHHYDELGLLSPSQRTAAGYRVYDGSDLSRLHRILSYRELGLDLREIAAVLDGTDEVVHLRRQRELLQEQIGRLQRMADTIDKLLEARQMGIELTPEEMFEVFGDEDPTEHAAEAQERWGDTDAYRESQRRASSYTKQDWLAIKAEGEDIESRFARALSDAVPADGPEAMDIAESHREHISRWFYACSHEMHDNLAQMYTEDPRFREHYDSREPGLAAYVRAAVAANLERSKSA